MRDMKDSGVEWIGEIPEDKHLIRNKYLLGYTKGKLPSETNFEGVGTPYIGASDLDSDEPYTTYTRDDGLPDAHDNDLLVLWDGARAGACGIHKKGKISSTIMRIRELDSTIYRPFLYWYYKGFEHYMYQRVSGTTIPHMSKQYIEEIQMIDWSIQEQKHIVDYLECKCRKIDIIIKKQQVIIEKLKEYKLSVITEAVTKGLNPNVEMKDSGIEWTERIPTHWSSMKLKYFTYVRARLGWKGLKAEEYVEEGYPLLSAFNIVNSKLDFRTNINYINQIRYDESPEIKLCLGDILLVKDGAGIGKCAIVEELPLPSTTNGSLAVITTDEKIVPKYLYYYFLSAMFQKYIDRLKAGMGVPHLFQADIKKIQVVIPSPMEQQEIVEKLDNKIKFVDSEITKIQTLLGKYKEYKSSLIYEVVTGKREV